MYLNVSHHNLILDAITTSCHEKFISNNSVLKCSRRFFLKLGFSCKMQSCHGQVTFSSRHFHNRLCSKYITYSTASWQIPTSRQPECNLCFVGLMVFINWQSASCLYTHTIEYVTYLENQLLTTMQKKQLTRQRQQLNHLSWAVEALQN